MSGEYAAVGRGLQLRVIKVPAIAHEPFEPAIGVLDDRIERRARLRTGRLESVRRRLERRRFDRFHLHADLAEEIGDIRILEQHADRADQRGLLRDDVVAGQRGDIAAGRGQAVDNNHQRFFLPHARQRVEQLLRTGGGTPGTVDVDDDSANHAGPCQPIELLGAVLVAADQAREGQARDIGTDAKTIIAAASQRGHAGDAEHDQDDRCDPPEAELPPHAAAIDDEIGIKRHGSYSLFALLVAGFVLFAFAFERCSQNVAQCRTGIRGSILGDRFLLLGYFERLDRDRNPARTAVELGDAGVDFLADGEAIGTLLGTVASQLRTFDEGGVLGADDLDLDAALLDLQHLAGDDRAFLEIAGGRIGHHGVLGELLDAERDALLLDINVENLRLHLVALLVFLDDLLARALPVEIGQVNHAVDVAVEAEEQAEFGLVLHFALDHRAGRIFLDEDLPRIAHRLLEPERDAALDRIDFEHLNLDLLRRRDDLAGVHVLLGPRHLRDVDQAFDTGFEFDERAIVGDIGDAALETRADRIFRLDALPRIVEQLFHAERDAVRLVIDLDDLDLHLLADIEHLGRMIDSPPSDVGDV